MCEVCRVKANIRRKAKRERLTVAGLCTECGLPNPSLPDRSICPPCRKLIVQYSKNRKSKLCSKGLCGRCGDAKPEKGKKHCTKCLIEIAVYQLTLHRKRRNAILEAYGRRCACCGETEPLFLALDHVNNDGKVDRRKRPWLTSSGGLYAKAIREGFPKRYQLLCVNCNWGKHANGGICPHKNKK